MEEIVCKDQLGRLVRLARPAKRLVSLVPSVTDTLFALGLSECIAAVTDYCTLPPGREGITQRCGGVVSPDVRRIVESRPELVVASADENRGADVSALEKERTTVYVAFPKTVRQAMDMIRDLATLTATEAACDRLLNSIGRAHDELLTPPPDSARVPMFCAIWKDPCWTFSDDTFAGDVLRLCGASNVFGARSERYFRVTLEEVASARPEIVLLPSEPYPFNEEDATSFQSLADLPAAKENRIHLFDGRDLFWYGAWMEKGLKRMRALISEKPGGAQSEKAGSTR